MNFRLSPPHGIYPSVCLCVCPSVWLCVHSSSPLCSSPRPSLLFCTRLSFSFSHISFCLHLTLSCLPVRLSVRLSVHLFYAAFLLFSFFPRSSTFFVLLPLFSLVFCPLVCLSICLSICLFTYLSLLTFFLFLCSSYLPYARIIPFQQSVCPPVSLLPTHSSFHSLDWLLPLLSLPSFLCIYSCLQFRFFTEVSLSLTSSVHLGLSSPIPLLFQLLSLRCCAPSTPVRRFGSSFYLVYGS